MNKKSLFIFLFSLAFILKAQTLPVDGVNYHVDTLENNPVGPGTQYISLRLTTGKKRMDVFFLKVDLKNSHIEIRNALGRDSIYSTERPSALAKRISNESNFYFAGTNGDFYNTSGYVGYPVAGNMVDGEIARIPSSNRSVFTIDDNKRPEIGHMAYSGNISFGDKNRAINSVNHIRGENQLVLFNRLNGKYTHTNSYGTEVLIELMEGAGWGSNKTLKAKVLKKEAGVGNMAIPKGKAVLSGHGTAAEVLNQLSENDEIELRLNLSINGNSVSNFLQMTGGDNYKLFLKDGVVEEQSVWNQLHPRTALGHSKNRDTLIFCVVDGRGVSNGATTKQLAYLMKSAGAWTAFNMDGGGSSCMYIAGYGGPVNRTSDGHERAVANSIYVVSTAPYDNEPSSLKAHKASVLLPLYGEYILKFYSYNQYGVMLSSDQQEVVLSCPEDLGRIEGNKFISSGNDIPGFITATYKGTVTTQIPVYFLPVSDLRIRLDSILTDNRRDYPIEVIASTSAGDAPISASALTWTVTDPEICQIENGVLKALKNGTTTVCGEINAIKDTLTVTVEIPSGPIVIGDSMKIEDWKLKASSFLNAQLNQTNLPSSWESGAAVNFTLKPGRTPFINLINNKRIFGLPDTVRFVMNVGDIYSLRAIFYFKAHNKKQAVSFEKNTVEQNKDFAIDIPLGQLFNTSDRAIYPISFDNVNFYLNTSGMTQGNSYTLAIKNMQLIYKDFLSSGIRPVANNRFGIFPNPVTHGVFNLQLNENKGQSVRTEIYELSGKLLISNRHGTYRGESLSVSTGNLASGIYFLKVYENEIPTVEKIYIQ